MSLTQDLIKEIERERVSTKKALERVPADKFDWKPHEKSNTLKGLSTHLAQLAAFPGMIASMDTIDLAQLSKSEINNADDLVNVFEDGINKSLEALKAVSNDEDLRKDWTLRYGDQVIMEMPKADAIRMMGLSHAYHHRAQLGVYLRMLDVPVPGTYGPSADEQ